MDKGNEISINVSLVFMRDQNDKTKQNIETPYMVKENSITKTLTST